MEANQFKSAWLILLAAAGMLLLYPLMHQRVPFLQEHFKNYRFFQQFLRAAVDTLPTDTIITPVDTVVAAPLPPPKYDGLEGLRAFYAALRGGREQVRIAHYGDSSIEGDLITASFRDSLQRRFGGAGVGFAPIVNPISGFRRSLLHSFSQNWYHCPLSAANKQGLPRGLSGEYASTWLPPPDTISSGRDSLDRDSSALEEADEGHWVFYSGAKLFATTRRLPAVRLFYAAPLPDSTGIRPPGGSVYFKRQGERARAPLTAGGTVNEALLSETPLNRISLYFQLPPTQAIYGVSLESPDGVVVDNFPSRGNSGSGLLRIPAPVLRDFQQYLDYDLVMLQFGLNVLNPKMTDYAWYEREMIRVIRRFRETMPEAAILVLGPSDRAVKRQGRMQTDPSVPRITEALRRAAETTGAGFFSFYEAMGGAGTMVEWVEERKPRLANLDYTHFNFSGAREAAFLLLDYLLAGYDEYRQGQIEPEAIGSITAPKSN